MRYILRPFEPLGIEQTDPPRSPRETLPTMYDLPSEDPEEPGLPDEFHDLQPQLLSATLAITTYAQDQIFTGTDLNLYYDVRHQRWYKRPDWFLVVGVPRLYEGGDMRLSYVMWQEGVRPLVVVELLSPGTRDDDLGLIEPQLDQPPGKWEVYEQILGVPYYVVFDRYTDEFRVFRLEGGHYCELELPDSKVWIQELKLGLGLWHGSYQGIERVWLRWYDAAGNWVPTPEEQAQTAEQRAQTAEQRAQTAEQRAQTAEQRAAQLAERLRALGIDPDAVD